MFFSRGKKIKNALIVNIGSSSVNYFTLLLNSNGETQITTTLRSRLPLLEDPDFKNIERHAKKAIKELSEDLIKKFASFRPDLIFIALSAPWYVSESKTVKIKRKEAFTIDEKLLESLMSDEVELFKTKAKESFPDFSGGEITITNKEIMRPVLNGYPIKKPFGKTTNELEFSIFMSASKKDFLESIKEMLHHYFGQATTNITAEPFAAFKILSKMPNLQEGFLVVDVGGEVTEVYLVRNDVLADVRSFRWGGNLVVRRLASLIGVDLLQALALFKTNAEGDLKENLDDKISPAVEGVCTQWQNLLSESLAELGKDAPLPQTLILIGGVAGSDVLKKCANSEEFASFTILGKPFNILTFIPETFDGMISLTGIDRKDPEMTIPLLLALSATDYARQN